MMPKWHVLWGFVLSIILIEFFKFSLFAALVVFFAAIFIDLDHVLIYCLETKNMNPFKFWKWSMKRKSCYEKLSESEKKDTKLPHFIFHGIELVLILIALTFISVFFLWILIGVVLHLILDFCILIYKNEHLSIKASQIWLWQRNKNKKDFRVE
jgi:hypothetical protein